MSSLDEIVPERVTTGGQTFVHDRRPEDDAVCERLGCEDRTHLVWHVERPAEPDLFRFEPPSARGKFVGRKP